MVNANDRLKLRPEDRAVSDPPALDAELDDVAIALDLETLGEIESKVLTVGGFNAEARTAIRQAAGRIAPGETRRLVLRAARALDDQRKVLSTLMQQTGAL